MLISHAAVGASVASAIVVGDSSNALDLCDSQACLRKPRDHAAECRFAPQGALSQGHGGLSRARVPRRGTPVRRAAVPIGLPLFVPDRAWLLRRWRRSPCAKAIITRICPERAGGPARAVRPGLRVRDAARGWGKDSRANGRCRVASAANPARLPAFGAQRCHLGSLVAGLRARECGDQTLRVGAVLRAGRRRRRTRIASKRRAARPAPPHARRRRRRPERALPRECIARR